MADPYEEYLKDDSGHILSDDIQETGRHLGRYFMIKLGSASIGYPFEMATVLRQCQVDRPVEETFEEIDESTDKLKQNLEDSSVSLDKLQSLSVRPYETERDEAGYIVSSSSTMKTSQWPVQLDKSKGIGNSALVLARRQGIFSLWNGLMASWAQRVAHDVSRAALEEAMEANDNLADFIDKSVPVIRGRIDLKASIIPVVAQAVSGFVFSPLDLIQTRMAVQSTYQVEQTYPSTIGAFRKIYQTEGGLSAFFPNPILTAVCKVAEPVLRVLPGVAYSQYFEEAHEDASLIRSLALLAGHFVSLSLSPFLILPLETIRRRLMIQPAGDVTLTCRIPVSQRRYKNALDCFISMVREEGIQSLYQGLTMHLSSSALLLAVNLVTELDEEIPEDFEEF